MTAGAIARAESWSGENEKIRPTPRVPAADLNWDKARGSSWGAKALILAPDKRGSFLFGEGVLSYVKPDGYVIVGLWFFDINAHAWTCLYLGMNTKTFTQRVRDEQLSLDDDGKLIDNDKQPIPLQTLVHAWDYLTYALILPPVAKG